MAAAVLGYLLWPGVLAYPGNDTRVRALLALQEEANAVLANRIALLHDPMAENACMLPEIAQERLPAELPLRDAGELPDVAADAAAVPDIAAAPVEEPDKAVGPLAARLDDATVLVLWMTEDDGGQGTGFFVAPDMIVTNLHVLGSPPVARVRISSRLLGGITWADVVARSDEATLGGADFALLRLSEASVAHILPLTRRVERLQSVVAAGFPGLAMGTDPAFGRLLDGDSSAMPVTAMTRGFVTAQQGEPDQVPLILHTATVMPGNSGGPLVDECGRLVGVNTFIKVAADGGSQLNYALGTDALLSFLRQQGVQLPVVDTVCNPWAAVAGGMPGGRQ